MVISQTPLRISLSGGGTDFGNYYLNHEGFVVSTAIDKYIYVIVKERFDDFIYVDYSNKEIVNSINDIKHDLVREAAKITNMTKGFEVILFADIPSEGSGLGSSSSLTVGLLHAFYAFQGKLITAEQLAHQACQIEIDILKQPIGKQDQYIAAYGGLCSFKFCKDGSVETNPIIINTEAKRKFGSNLLLFFTKTTRSASAILTEQNKNILNKIDFLHKIKDLAFDSYHSILKLEFNQVGENLKKNWELKKQLASNVSNTDIDKMYNLAIQGGATGAKISGAGGGGFLLVYCERDKQDNLRNYLKDYRELPFYLEKHGSKIIFDQTRYDIK